MKKKLLEYIVDPKTKVPLKLLDAQFDGDDIVIGLDYSLAVDVAKNNFKKNDNVHIIQADALSLPLKESKIDGTYSIGVLHHTPNPELPDIDWAILDTFDSLSPAYASTHESDEVESWFLNANFQKLSKMDWNDATFRGIK